jgi:TetR/AcrR family transcriptional regulator, repressor for uid operon
VPRLTQPQQDERRTRILDAAELVFARKGFAGATMQEICREAGISPGALYLYFRSKEDLIAGIADRDRRMVMDDFEKAAKAENVLEALSQIGEYYLIERPAHQTQLFIEIGAEATRNPRVAAIFQSVDQAIRRTMEDTIRTAQARGQIDSKTDPQAIADLLGALGDGLFWRRATDPGFDSHRTMQVIALVLHALAIIPAHSDPVAMPVYPASGVATFSTG